MSTGLEVGYHSGYEVADRLGGALLAARTHGHADGERVLCVPELDAVWEGDTDLQCRRVLGA